MPGPNSYIEMGSSGIEEPEKLHKPSPPSSLSSKKRSKKTKDAIQPKKKDRYVKMEPDATLRQPKTKDRYVKMEPPETKPTSLKKSKSVKRMDGSSKRLKQMK